MQRVLPLYGWKVEFIFDTSWLFVCFIFYIQKFNELIVFILSNEHGLSDYYWTNMRIGIRMLEFDKLDG